MTPSVVIISTPSIDFDTFIGLSQQVLGYSPAAAVDASRRQHSDSERFIACLAALRDRSALPGDASPNLLAFAAFGLFFAADERDMLDIMESCAGMPAVVADTLATGVVATVIHGTVAQWRDAVRTGCHPLKEHNIRACFNLVRNLFIDVGLDVWKDCTAKPMADQTFYLEDKRR